MAEKNNAVCAICGKEYHLCIRCNKDIKVSPWKVHTDTAEHYKIYTILHGLTTGIYTEKEAREKLLKVDLSDLKEYKRDDIRKRINEIIGNKDTFNKPNNKV